MQILFSCNIYHSAVRLRSVLNLCLIFGPIMASGSVKGKAIVIMGVSGSGKSTIGEALAEAMKCKFLDADDFHSRSNKEKMHQGIPLSEEDRIPWLEILRDALTETLISGQTAVLACSSLQKRYRDILRSADLAYQNGSHPSAIKFVLLDAKAEVLMERLKKRATEGKHFMPANLLPSQLDLLQADDSEKILKIDATLSPQAIVNTIQAWV
uniref:Gluconokinase n=3 Tax=Rhizophora mucronata TaxID=61149 RepID=A0A2P2J792_RHIMU